MLRRLITLLSAMVLTGSIAYADSWKNQSKQAEKYWEHQRKAREKQRERAEEYWEEQRERAEDLRDRQREAYEDYLDDLEDARENQNNARRFFRPAPPLPACYYPTYPRPYFFPTPNHFDYRFYQHDD